MFQEGGDEIGLEHFLSALFQAVAGGGEAEFDLAGVATGALAAEVAGAFESVHIQGHGGGGDAHVPGEGAEVGGFDGVQVVQNGGLVEAEVFTGCGFGVAHVASVAGVENLRVEAQEGGDLVIERHGSRIRKIV